MRPVLKDLDGLLVLNHLIFEKSVNKQALENITVLRVPLEFIADIFAELIELFSIGSI